jgi:hypothetical protein
MKFRALAVSVLAVAWVQAEISPADVLLDEVISHPGSYSQVCDVMTLSEDVPLRAYVMGGYMGADFSKETEARMQKNRDGLVAAARKRLLAIDFTRAAKEVAADPKAAAGEPGEADGDTFGNDPATLNPLLLSLLEKLDATEALPELLKLEARLVEEISKVKKDPSVPSPVVDGWGVVPENFNYDEKISEAERDKRRAFFNARVAQRDLVTLMAMMMRSKAYPAFLATSLEAAYAKSLKTGQAALEKKQATGAQETGGVKIETDPITHFLRQEYDSVEVPYSRELRDEVRAAAEKWVKEHS